MDDKKSILIRDLNHLERYQNPPERMLKIGFNQKRKKTSMKLKLPSSDMSVLMRAEKELIKDIREIDQALQKKHSLFRYQHGYLFAVGMANNLTGHLGNVIATSGDTVEHGFSIWRVHQEEGAISLVSGKIGHSPPPFSSKLTQKSLEKLEQYSSKKLEQSIKQNLKPWEYFASKQHQRVKTEGGEIHTIRRESKKVQSKPRKNSEMHRKYTFRDSSFEEQRVGSLLELKGGTRGRYITQTEAPRQKGSPGLSFGELVPRPTSQELTKMLLKENKIVSIWIPPSSYAHLFAVLSLQIKERDGREKTCWISKYFMLKHSINRRIFNCLLDWVQTQYGDINELALTTTKHNYDKLFSGAGWKLTCWLNEQRVRICFKRMPL